MRWLGIVLIALAAALAGFFLSQTYFNEPLPASRLSAGGIKVGDVRPEFRLANSEGQFVTASDFDGKVLLVNFWATWCEPCRREMPMLMELQTQHGLRGLQVLGIALDDVGKVRNFVRNFGIRYPILVGAADVMQTSAAYGNVNGVLPYSVLIDRTGIIRWQYIGEISRAEVTTLLEAYL
jgi:peroxiredoxin